MRELPRVKVVYISSRSENLVSREGTLKEASGDSLLIDTGEVENPDFNTSQNTRVLVDEGIVKTETANKTENLGRVIKIELSYDTPEDVE